MCGKDVTLLSVFSELTDGSRYLHLRLTGILTEQDASMCSNHCRKLALAL